MKALDKWLAQPGNMINSLSRPERFLAGLCKLPRLKQKLLTLQFRCQFAEVLRDALAILQHVQDACAQVPASA